MDLHALKPITDQRILWTNAYHIRRFLNLLMIPQQNVASIVFSVENIARTDECDFVGIADFQLVGNKAVSSFAIRDGDLFDMRCSAGDYVPNTYKWCILLHGQ